MFVAASKNNYFTAVSDYLFLNSQHTQLYNVKQNFKCGKCITSVTTKRKRTNERWAKTDRRERKREKKKHKHKPITFHNLKRVKRSIPKSRQQWWGGILRGYSNGIHKNVNISKQTEIHFWKFAELIFCKRAERFASICFRSYFWMKQAARGSIHYGKKVGIGHRVAWTAISGRADSEKMWTRTRRRCERGRGPEKDCVLRLQSRFKRFSKKISPAKTF